MRPLLTILLVFSLTLTYAQIKPPISFPKTVKVDFGNGKKTKTNANVKLTKAEKDSLKVVKKEIKRLKKQGKDVVDNEVQKAKGEFLPYDSSYLKSDSMNLDSLGTYGKEEAIRRAKQLAENTDEYQQFGKYGEDIKSFQNEMGELPNDPDAAAQMVESKAGQFASQHTEQLTKKDLLEQQYRQQIEEMRAKVQAEKAQAYYERFAAYADINKLKAEAGNQLRGLAKDKLGEVADEQVGAAMQQMAKYKRKYDSFSSVEDIGKMKPYSLADVPLKDRLDIGGSLQIHRGNPVSIDISPSITFWYNKRLALGLGGTYRVGIGKVDKHLVTDDEVFGFRGFGQYKLGSWFAHGEFENLNLLVVERTTDDENNEWVPGAMLGIGKYYNVGMGIKGNVTILYNFLHDPLKSPYNHPVVVRVGFSF